MSDSSSSSSSRNWSPLQTAIFGFVKTMETNLVIVARAGCGKTTTIIECAKFLPAGRVMFCAFNKSIATELADRLPSNVEAKTLHSLGFSMIRKAFRTVKVDENKGKDISKSVVTERLKEANFDLAGKVAKVAALGKNMMVSDAKGLGLLAIDFDIAENGEVGLLSELAEKAMEVSAKNTNVVDFDDMIYFPWKFNLTLPFHDFVIVDEAQDMNAAQLWIARNLAKKGGKMIIVGDDRQAIYGFRGAEQIQRPSRAWPRS